MSLKNAHKFMKPADAEIVLAQLEKSNEYADTFIDATSVNIAGTIQLVLTFLKFCGDDLLKWQD